MSGAGLPDDTEVESPCVRICVIHPRVRICTGCLRSMEEIMRWRDMDSEARRAVLAALPEREASLKVRRGGRRGRLRENGAG
jgi:hypothetical protein